MPIRFKYDVDFYQKVFLVTDNKQLPWQVTGIYLTPNGPVFNLSRAGYDDVEAYDGQFTLEEDTLLRTTSNPDDED